MFLHFHLRYRTVYGEQIGIQYSSDSTETDKIQYFQTNDGENWSGTLELKDSADLNYKYILLKNEVIILKEWGKNRKLQGPGSGHVYLEDRWRPVSYTHL